MSALEEHYNLLKRKKENASMHIFTLGTFEAIVKDRLVSTKEWGRDKTVQLFQFLITARSRRSLHKEQIINRLWEDSVGQDGDRDFKVAMHGINKALEPNRPPRTDPYFIQRQGVAYQINTSDVWIDAQALEDFIILGNQCLNSNRKLAIEAYQSAIQLHQGTYLPNRTYEDWSSEERERLQVLILSTYITLAELIINEQPLEAVRLTQKAISIDSTWEDAYQIQMKAYLLKGNRPGAIKTYHQCVKVLDSEYGLDPLPETQAIFDGIF